jgi:glycosyltransferase involved in cell wall biosynthesis
MNNEGPFGIIGQIIPCEEISDHAILSRTPLVSVHMITYNHEPYIAQAIKGVLQQKTDFQIELIIGEDCSTDRTREIVLEYQKKYPAIIRVITSEKNVGMHRNHRRVYAASRGKYIAFCEGDDFWHNPLKLKKQIEYLENHTEVGLVHSDVAVHYVETGKTIKSRYSHEKRLHNDQKVLRGLIEGTYVVSTCSAICRRAMISEIYKTCQYEFSDKFMMGDIQTWVEIAYRAKVKYIDEKYATQNALPESAWRSKDIEKKIKLWENKREILIHFAQKYGFDEKACIISKIIKHKNKILLPVAFHYYKPELGKKTMEYSKRYNVAFDIKDYLYYIGSKNYFFYYFVKILTIAIRILRRLIRYMQKDRLKK